MGWKARVLAQVGKMVLINSNLSGVPLYTMLGIKILNYIANEVDNANRKLVRSNNLDSDHIQSKTPIIAWDKISRPKCEGGLGITTIKDINAATQS